MLATKFATICFTIPKGIHALPHNSNQLENSNVGTLRAVSASPIRSQARLRIFL